MDNISTTFIDVIRRIDRAIKVRTKNRRGDLSLSALRLVFLKYAVDNHLGAKTIGDMEIYFEIQRAISSYDGEKTVQMAPKVLDLIELQYGLSNILNNETILNEYKNDILGTDETKKRQALDKHFQNILEALSTADLKDDVAGNVGKTVVKIFMSSISSTSKWNKATSELSSSDAVALIGKEILDVSSNDVFLDFVSGIGRTTLIITNGCDPQIINVDNDAVACCTDAMALILDGHKKLDIRCGNSLDGSIQNIKANKIFVDFIPDKPIEMMKVIDKAIENYCDNNGKCVLTVSKKFLISVEPQVMQYRKKMVESKIMESVIAVNDNYLLVFGKNCDDKLKFIYTSEDELNSTGAFHERYIKMPSSGKMILSVPFDKLGRFDDSNNLESYDILPQLYFQDDVYEIDIQAVNKELNTAYTQLRALEEPVVSVEGIDEAVSDLMMKLL